MEKLTKEEITAEIVRLKLVTPQTVSIKKQIQKLQQSL
tara:strand:- start:5895 stop:6008 length:114 start_codon:yes stop_codon:yes gene_type:complete